MELDQTTDFNITFTPNVKIVIIALNNMVKESSHIDLMTPAPASAAGYLRLFTLIVVFSL
jgi:hypothetical protein